MQGLVKSGEAVGSPFQACLEGLDIALSKVEVKECKAMEKLKMCRRLRRSLSGAHASVNLLQQPCSLVLL